MPVHGEPATICQEPEALLQRFVRLDALQMKDGQFSIVIRPRHVHPSRQNAPDGRDFRRGRLDGKEFVFGSATIRVIADLRPGPVEQVAEHAGSLRPHLRLAQKT